MSFNVHQIILQKSVCLSKLLNRQGLDSIFSRLCMFVAIPSTNALPVYSPNFYLIIELMNTCICLEYLTKNGIPAVVYLLKISAISNTLKVSFSSS